MKLRGLLIAAACMMVCLTSHAVKKSDVSVLYVGGSASIETMARSVDAAEVQKECC